MSTYGITNYGDGLYGKQYATTATPGGNAIPTISSAYLIDPFTAVAVDYQSVLLTWTEPDPSSGTPMNEYRLLSSRYGFPVDENDGTAVFDTTSPPGSSYLDQNVIPGAFTYYGFYILGAGGQWIRAGFAACLMPVSHGSGASLLGFLPEYLRDISDSDLTGITAPSAVLAPPVPSSGVTLINPYAFPVQVTLDGGSVTDVVSDGIDLGALATQFWVDGAGTVAITYDTKPAWSWLNVPAGGGNPYLQQYLEVAGWGMDYLKTQYDLIYNTLNDPMQMPLSDLAQLAGQLGVPFQAELPAYFMRKAVLNWATVMQQRGSLAGIAEHISLLTGYGADVQLSRNIMLDNDQSMPQDPAYPAWSANLAYRTGELVRYPVYHLWSVGTNYVAGNGVAYNGVNYLCTAAVTAVPPGVSGAGAYWSATYGPYTYSCAAANIGEAPLLPGSVDSAPPTSGYWAGVTDVDLNPSPLAIPGLVGGVSTWETVYPSQAGSYAVPSGALVEGDGVMSPLNPGDYAHNSIRAYNKGGSTQDIWVRSVSRGTSDLANTTLNGNFLPDPQTVVEHAIPVPQSSGPWDAATRYATGAVATWYGLPYLANRASTGATPPVYGMPLNDNFDFETGVAPWTAYDGATVAQSAAFAYHGSHSILLTPDGTSGYPGARSENIPVIPLATYTSTPHVYIPGGYSQVQVNVGWYDAWGQSISSASSTVVSVGSAVWTPVPVSVQAPANAAAATLNIQLNATPASSVLSYWDLSALSCVSTPEWSPLGAGPAIPLMVSADISQSLSTAPNETFAVTPFAEFYDDWGNFICRVFARTPTAGTPGSPASYVYDGFDSAPGSFLQGRTADSGSVWSVPVGSWSLNADGSVYPTTAGAKSVATVPVSSSATQALTFDATPYFGQDLGLVFWYQSTTTYWHAGMSGLYYSNAGTWSLAVTYAHAFSPGDRIYVVTNKTTPAVTVYRNFIGAYNSATGNGLVGQITGDPPFGTTIPSAMVPSGSTSFSGIASEAV